MPLALLPLLLGACASAPDAPKAQSQQTQQQQVSCSGVVPRTGTNLVRKSDCIVLTPEEAAERQQQAEELRQNLEMQRASRTAVPTR